MILVRTQNQLNPNPYVEYDTEYNSIFELISEWGMPVELFDQNGYDLTNAERAFYHSNNLNVTQHRNITHNALKYSWYEEAIESRSGVHLNHCLLFERKGFAGDARKQLMAWARDYPLLHKLLHIRPKWGFDLSIDYADENHSFEVFHYEYDGFDYNEIVEHQRRVEKIIDSYDWDYAAKGLIARKEEWHSLDFFGQSDWKCKYFGLPSERFKEVIWE